MSDPLFGGLFSTPEVDARVGATAWLQAMLDFEGALARACARAGLVPAAAAEAVSAACVADQFPIGEIGREAVSAATPVPALVKHLTARVPADAAVAVHVGATSQDVVDTAMMLVARSATEPVLEDLAVAADALADHTERHRDTVMLGRTLLQQALPTTFGVVCAGWLVALDEARTRLAQVRRERLAVQFGGAVGTLAALGDAAPHVAALLAQELGLPSPDLPWHTSRSRVAELAAAIAVVTGAVATVALDVTLLSQTELGELAEGAPGGSSAMPHKRNPARSTLVTACAHRVPGLVASILAGQPQELQRSPGRWQAEWGAVTDLLKLCGAAAAHHGDLVADLRVDARRMRSNLDAAGDLYMAENVVTRLAATVGRQEAREIVAAAVAKARADDVSLRVALDRPELADAFDPTSYLGWAGLLVDRALTAHGENT
ncbi:3-carboxy-cis,cis-muconate cycloisomerase [Virgisporangium aliadipatigenens]|uniref:3-carboxy-cis,cis-muconate cycloisomerase n=1 Tax=Virgisporangium aliadipatigenens TaxID=741659 RepID=A0A8J4DSN7_9ACTN|nr:3-carboxy-cis,cis-muconate cycloisomerase [Virgisporangium aliadipatigenens]GIJ49435.1 3-carboxy-cis,cis-muconate cycloisomerase [Virgisporangium aliadipatigenens]